jgi:hypothetical protein
VSAFEDEEDVEAIREETLEKNCQNMQKQCRGGEGILISVLLLWGV